MGRGILCEEGFERLTRHRRQLLAFPDDGRVFVNIANALRLTDQLSDGLSWARWSVRDELGLQLALRQRPSGSRQSAADLGRFEEVDRAYALADPGQTNARIQFNRSRVMQGLGRWRESWSLAESRWMDGGEALEGLHRGRIGRAGPMWIGSFSGTSRGLVTRFRPCAGCHD